MTKYSHGQQSSAEQALGLSLRSTRSVGGGGRIFRRRCLQEESYKTLLQSYYFKDNSLIIKQDFHSNSHQILGFVEKLTRAKMKQGISSRQFPYAKIRILPHFEKIH